MSLIVFPCDRKRKKKLEFKGSESRGELCHPPLPSFPDDDAAADDGINVVPETQSSSSQGNSIPCSQRRMIGDVESAGEGRIILYSVSFVRTACVFRSGVGLSHSFKFSDVHVRQRLQRSKYDFMLNLKCK